MLISIRKYVTTVSLLLPILLIGGLGVVCNVRGMQRQDENYEGKEPITFLTHLFELLRSLPICLSYQPLFRVIPYQRSRCFRRASKGADIGVLVRTASCAVGEGHGIDLALRFSDSNVCSPPNVSFGVSNAI